MITPSARRSHVYHRPAITPGSPSPQKENFVRDRVSLGEGQVSSNPPSPVTRAVATSAAGPLAPTLSEQLENLPVKFFKRKWIRWPWSDPHKELSAAQAAEHFQGDRSRLRVDYGDGIKPLRGEQQLAVLEAQIQGHTSRPLEASTRWVVEKESRDAAGGDLLKPYDAILQLHNDGPIVAWEEGRPLLRLDHREDEPAPRTAPDASDSLRLARTLVEALDSDFDSVHRELIRDSAVPEPEKRVLKKLVGLVPDKNLSGRLEALRGSQNYEQSVLALTPLGWFKKDQDSETLGAAHTAFLRFGRDPELLSALDQCARTFHEGRQQFFQELERSPQKAFAKLYPGNDRLLRDIFSQQKEAEAVATATLLGRVKNLALLQEGTPTVPVAGRVRLLAETVEDDVSRQALAFLEELKTQGMNDTEAEKTAVDVFRALESARVYDHYYHLTHTVEPALDQCRKHFLDPKVKPARQLYLELLAKRDANAPEVVKLLKDVPGLNLSQRVDLFRDYAKNSFPMQRYQVTARHLEAGSDLTTARKACHDLIEAAEGLRQYDDTYHGTHTLAPILELYQSQLVAPGREPARELFLDLLRKGDHRYGEVTQLLEPVTGLDLKQRVDLFAELKKEPFALPKYQTVAEHMKAGSSLAEAQEQTRAVVEAAEGIRQYDDQYHETHTLEPVLQTYRARFTQPEHAPARALFLELLAAGDHRYQEVEQLLPEVNGLNLEQRIELYRRLHQGKFAMPHYQVIGSHLDAGLDLAQAEKQAAEFFQAAEGVRQYDDHYHQSHTLAPLMKDYQQKMVPPANAPARELYLELLKNGDSRYAEVAKLLAPVPGLNLEQRVELYKELSSGKFALPHYELMAGHLGVGNSLDEAKRLSQELFEAAEGVRQYDDHYHQSHTLPPILDLYQKKLLDPQRAPLRRLVLEQLKEGDGHWRDASELVKAAGGLDLQQRVDLYREQRGHPIPLQRYGLLTRFMESGHSEAEAKAEITEFYRAAEKLKVYDDDLYHHQHTLPPVIEAYKSLSDPSAKPLRKLYRDSLQRKSPLAEPARIGTAAPHISLDQKTRLFEEFDYRPNEVASILALLEDGHDPDEARSRLREFKQLLAGHEGDYYAQHLAQSYAGTSSVGRLLVVSALKGGFQAYEVYQTLPTLAEPLERLSNLGFSEQDVEKALSHVDRRTPLSQQLESILEVLVLKAEENPDLELDIEVTEDEVVVGDFLVDRQE